MLMPAAIFAVPEGSCGAIMRVNSWSGGYVAMVTVSAGAEAVSGWTVGMTDHLYP